MGEEHWHVQKKRGGISPGELLHSGTHNPIRMDISTTRRLGHGRCIFGSGKNDPGNLFASYFLQKYKIPLTHLRISKYYAGQEIRIGTPESSDVRKVKIPKFSAGKRGTNLGRDGGRCIIQLRPPSDNQVRKA